MRNEIGERIKELRKRNGITQEELAKKLGVTKGTVSKWELSTTETLKTSYVRDIALALDTTVPALLGMEDIEDNRVECSNEEKLVIETYREADTQTKEMVKRLLAYYERINALKK